MLNVDKLSFAFHRRPLFEQLSFHVEPGQLWLVVGGNGTGKSTLLSVIVGLLPATHGHCTFAGGDRAQVLEYLAAETNGLFFKLDAMQNLKFWAKMRGVSCGTSDLHAALDRWQLNHPLIRQDFPIEKFSTGMKRRLALARVGLSQAKLWVMDEPFHGLDQKALVIFADVLGQHLNQGGSAIVVSHDLAPLANLPHQRLDLERFRGRAQS